MPLLQYPGLGQATFTNFSVIYIKSLIWKHDIQGHDIQVNLDPLGNLQNKVSHFTVGAFYRILQI